MDRLTNSDRNRKLEFSEFSSTNSERNRNQINSISSQVNTVHWTAKRILNISKLAVLTVISEADFNKSLTRMRRTKL